MPYAEVFKKCQFCKLGKNLHPQMLNYPHLDTEWKNVVYSSYPILCTSQDNQLDIIYAALIVSPESSCEFWEGDHDLITEAIKEYEEAERHRAHLRQEHGVGIRWNPS